jgi:hypothetical protein
MASFSFKMSSLSEGAPIPTAYTCDGPDVSPPLSWTAPPDGTERLVLVVDDPDAPGPGSFTHWVVFNLPPTVTELPRAVDIGALGHDGPTPAEGTNSFGDEGYGGPCPPPGEQHRYIFSVYALDTTLDLAAGVGPMAVVGSMMGHVQAQTELVGTYRRDDSASDAHGSRGARTGV